MFCLHLTVHLHSTLTHYTYKTRSQFSNCRLLIVYQDILHNKCQKNYPAETVRAWTRLIMDYRSLSKVTGLLQMVWQTQKCLGEVSLYFQMELNMLGVLSVPTNKNLKGWCRLNSGAVPKCLRTYVDMNSFPAFGVGNLPLKYCPSILDTLCIPIPHIPLINSLAA